MTTNDYSIYLKNKRIQVAQSGFLNINSLKSRSTIVNFAYFPLYKSIGLPINNLRSNKFLNVISSTPNVPTVFKYILTLLSSDVDIATGSGEPTSGAYDGNNTIYITTYFPTSSGTGIIAYNIATNTPSVFLTKAQSTTSTYGIAYDSARSCLYVGNLAGSIIKVSLPDKTVTSLGSSAGPWGIAYDGSTYLYIANAAQHTITRLDVTAGGSATVFAGANGSANNTNGALLTARFNSPTGVACDGTSAVYVADSGNRLIRKIDIATSQVTTIAGSGSNGFVDGIGTSASFNALRGLDIDTVNKKLYITDEVNHAFRELNLTTNEVKTVAGTGSSGATVAPDGDALQSTFNSPRGCVFISPFLYALDTRNNDLKRIKLF